MSAKKNLNKQEIKGNVDANAVKNKILDTLEEDHKKFGILQVFEGLNLIVTEHMVLNIWNHDTPITYLKECICYQLQRMNKDQLHTKFTAEEYEVLSSTLVYALVFAKNEL